jgi:hypothetical protein
MMLHEYLDIVLVMVYRDIWFKNMKSFPYVRLNCIKWIRMQLSKDITDTYYYTERTDICCSTPSQPQVSFNAPENGRSYRILHIKSPYGLYFQSWLMEHGQTRSPACP